MRSIKPLFGFIVDLGRALRQSRQATRDGGVSLLKQIWELILLRAGPGKLTPDDYYLMRVYRRTLTFTEKSKYLSNWALGKIVWDRRWQVVADDKLLTYGILLAQGIRIPELHAVFHPARTFRNCPTLKSTDELEEYLITHATYPFFSKPITGIYSKGVMLVKSLDSATNTLLLGDGSSLPLQQYLRHCSQGPSGYLIQELLHPHPKIAALCGDRLCTVRIIVLFDSAGPRLYRALWKIAAPGNMADNYWRKGNMLALLDIKQGIVRRCTTGLGPDTREIERHPETNNRLIDFPLPCWDEVLDLTMKAACAMPGLPIQAWDIAPTTKGPLALEVNDVGSLFLPQIADQAGLYQGEFREFMDAHKN